MRRIASAEVTDERWTAASISNDVRAGRRSAAAVVDEERLTRIGVLQVPLQRIGPGRGCLLGYGKAVLGVEDRRREQL